MVTDHAIFYLSLSQSFKLYEASVDGILFFLLQIYNSKNVVLMIYCPMAAAFHTLIILKVACEHLAR